MHELSNYIDRDVEQRLRFTCDIHRVDVGNQFARLNERKPKLEQGVESVVDAAGDRLEENNHRNITKEWMLGQITTTLIGLSAKMEQNIKDTQQIHENQTLTGKRMEEENKNSGDEIKKSINSATRQDGKKIERGRYDQTMASQSSIVGG